MPGGLLPNRSYMPLQIYGRRSRPVAPSQRHRLRSRLSLTLVSDNIQRADAMNNFPTVSYFLLVVGTFAATYVVARM